MGAQQVSLVASHQTATAFVSASHQAISGTDVLQHLLHLHDIPQDDVPCMQTVDAGCRRGMPPERGLSHNRKAGADVRSRMRVSPSHVRIRAPRPNSVVDLIQKEMLRVGEKARFTARQGCGKENWNLRGRSLSWRHRNIAAYFSD